MARRTQPTRETHEQVTIRMINDPNSWPNIVLPLKRYKVKGAMPEIAILACSMDGKKTYRIAVGSNIWDDKPANFVDTTPEQVLRDGWLVD